jgi:hypothetical protein
MQIVLGEVDGTLNGRVQVYSFPEQLYDITLVNLIATFSDDDTSEPEVELFYVNSAPAGVGYYKMAVLSPNCTDVDSTGAIQPIQHPNGTIPIPTTNAGTSDAIAMVDIDTAAIEGTEYYVPPETNLDSGKIAFCVRVDFFDLDDRNLASETSKITLHLDFLSSWELDGVDGTRKAPSETVHYVNFQYTTEAFFCDDNNEEVTPARLFPGQGIQVCVKTPVTSDVEVVGLRSVVFKNELVSFCGSMTLFLACLPCT